MSAPLRNHNRLLLRVGLILIAALAVVMAMACGSEPAPPPTPTALPTAVPLVAPTVAPTAPSAGGADDRAMAPNFSLSSASGGKVSLSGLLEDHKAVIIVFYRGYF